MDTGHRGELFKSKAQILTGGDCAVVQQIQTTVWMYGHPEFVIYSSASKPLVRCGVESVADRSGVRPAVASADF